jgi:hypothetical protein
MKLKYKENIVSSNSNYSNAKSNALLTAAIRKQIPNEFRDIIGTEEMLKMSKIYTGVNIKCINVNSKI